MSLFNLTASLDGLSVNLNHLIAWRLGISFQQFGTLPIGIFLLNFDAMSFGNL